MILRETAWLLAAGVVVGILGATLATRKLESVLFGLAPMDQVTIAAVIAVVAVVAAVAGYLPARRASNTHPLTALRHE
jgi:ABC-type antimicrobial peptide transport system permease subunit